MICVWHDSFKPPSNGASVFLFISLDSHTKPCLGYHDNLHAIKYKTVCSHNIMLPYHAVVIICWLVIGSRDCHVCFRATEPLAVVRLASCCELHAATSLSIDDWIRCVAMQCDRCNVIVCHHLHCERWTGLVRNAHGKKTKRGKSKAFRYLENDVLIAIAECWAKWIGRVCSAGTM